MLRTFAIVLFFVAAAAANCDVTFKEPRPIVVKRLGSKTAIIKPLSIVLSQNEAITLHCPSGFNVDPPYEKAININAGTTELLFTDNNIYFDEHKMFDRLYDRVSISCLADFKGGLYESNSSLVGCDSDAMTLLVGYRLDSHMPDVKLLGMCYDLTAMRLRFVSFLANAPSNGLLETRMLHELDALQLDSYIGSLSKYLSFVSVEKFQMLISTHLGELFHPDLFEYGSLLQDTTLSAELSEYSDMLSIVWLRSLRDGNWKHWLSALRTASNDDSDGAAAAAAAATAVDKYEVRVGVSGVATLPLVYNCNASRPLLLTSSDVSDRTSLTVPAYIWAHVRALQPAGITADEFVLVAHNSPFVNVSELSSFCDDICTEIPWLRNSRFGQLHLVPNYGVMHCCRMDQLHKLTDFPLYRTARPLPPPVNTPTTTTTTPSTPPSTPLRTDNDDYEYPSET